MVEYVDLTKYASRAYIEALMENEKAARSAAIKAVEDLGLNTEMATEVADEVAIRHQAIAQDAKKIA